MWQRQCDVAVTVSRVTIEYVPIFVILSQFGPNFLKTESISSLYQI